MFHAFSPDTCTIPTYTEFHSYPHYLSNTILLLSGFQGENEELPINAQVSRIRIVEYTEIEVFIGEAGVGETMR